MTARLRVKVLVCGGRPLDDKGAPIGKACGRVFPRRIVGGLTFGPDLALGGHCAPEEPLPWSFYIGEARAAGWAVGPADEAMCPRCRRPDPKLAKLCRELAPGGV